MPAMRSPLLFGLAVLLGLPVVALAQDRDKLAAQAEALRKADEEAFAANMSAYEADVQPFLTAHCIGCHGPKKLEGDLSLDLLDPDMKTSTSAARWATVRQRIEAGEMPPEGHKQPTTAEVGPVLDWIKAEMKRARRNFTKRVQPVNGNAIPHELLFDPEHRADLDVPPRLRRHSVEIYEQFRREQAKGYENLVSNPFSPDPRFLFADMGTPELDVPTTTQLLRNALTLVERQTSYKEENGELKPLPGARREFFKFLDPKQTFEAEQMAEAVTLQFRRVLGRSPSEAEQERFVALMQKNVKDAGRVSGVRHTLAAVYLLPETLFRYEVGSEDITEGRTRLTPHQIAEALAFALTDKRPEDWLVKAAEAGDLDTSEGVATAVQTMLDNEKLAKPRILRFFHEYFEYPKAVAVFKDEKGFKAHKATHLVSDTDNLIRWILDRDKDVIAELLSTDRSFVNARVDEKSGKIEQVDRKRPVHLSYSLPPDWKWNPEQPIKMPGNTRAGILTQPSWLVAWSTNEHNHAILRGKWVRERLLGQVVPDIPITVDAQLPHDESLTLREKMRVTEEAYCWQCHKLMNPVGLPFESFDHYGRWRALELDKPVDASGRIDLVSDKRLETEVDGAIEFVQHLAQSERVEQVFIRHAFRFFAGRNENLGDGPSLRAVHNAYRESGGSFDAIIVGILSSDSFLYRTPESFADSSENR